MGGITGISGQCESPDSDHLSLRLGSSESPDSDHPSLRLGSSESIVGRVGAATPIGSPHPPGTSGGPQRRRAPRRRASSISVGRHRLIHRAAHMGTGAHCAGRRPVVVPLPRRLAGPSWTRLSGRQSPTRILSDSDPSPRLRVRAALRLDLGLRLGSVLRRGSRRADRTPRVPAARRGIAATDEASPITDANQ